MKVYRVIEGEKYTEGGKHVGRVRVGERHGRREEGREEGRERWRGRWVEGERERETERARVRERESYYLYNLAEFFE